MTALAPSSSDVLSASEKAALKRSRELGEPSLEEDAASAGYKLFKRGVSCVEVAELLQASHGQVLRARVEGAWDRRRNEYQRELLDAAKPKLIQVTLEAVDHLTSMLTAMHTVDKQKYQRAIATGSSQYLVGTMAADPKAMKAYRDALETLKMLTDRPNTPTEDDDELTDSEAIAVCREHGDE